jgi:hypothetical protein
MAMIALFIATSAGAVDGVLEINQACAFGSGCFVGDAAGFPVEISNPGSYRLTSNLTQPTPNTPVISINAGEVDVDLNGFAIQGANVYPGPPGGNCTASGTGVGVVSSIRRVAVRNGHVRGMGSDGIVLTNTAHVERIVAEDNCGDGVRVGVGSLVIDTIARANRRDGIQPGSVTVVRNCVAASNGENGVNGSSSDIVVDGCVADSNGLDGVVGGAGSQIRGCLTLLNGDDGIEVQSSGLVIESVANDNADVGIEGGGTLVQGNATARGLSVAVDNTNAPLTVILPIGCNLWHGFFVECP